MSLQICIGGGGGGGGNLFFFQYVFKTNGLILQCMINRK